MNRTSRDFDVYIPGRNEPVSFAGKAHSVVDGMGTRIINHDGTVAFSMAGAVTVVETNSVDEDIPDPVVVSPDTPASK